MSKCLRYVAAVPFDDGHAKKLPWREGGCQPSSHRSRRCLVRRDRPWPRWRSAFHPPPAASTASVASVVRHVLGAPALGAEQRTITSDGLATVCPSSVVGKP